jgi:ribosomal protein L24
VIAVDPRNGKIKVEGAMLVKKHQKAIPQMTSKAASKNVKHGSMFPTWL